MKKLKLLIVFTFIASLHLAAQHVPKAATDISPLLIGEKIPEVQLTDIKGVPVSLLELAAQKQTVLIFYRGGWCPYCNMHLSELQEAEAEIVKAGYQIVAISPDSPDSLGKSVDKHKLKYILLSDSDTKAAYSFGLAFEAPENYHGMLGRYSNNKNKGILPVPAVFVLNKQGEILFEYINPNFKERLKASLLLAVLKETKE